MDELIEFSKMDLHYFQRNKTIRSYPKKARNSQDEILSHFKVLMIGTGGIGCELLKNLVVSGFSHIEIVDMDTIELSNLNRQFLFRKKDIGKSKAEVAKKRAEKFNKKATIIAHHDNIKNDKFDLNFFKKFDIVLNALDNVKTRKHVNRLCLSLNIPLIESGTQAYTGQVYLIKKDVTECYECNEKPMIKTYAVCTIRDTPDLPVHCIAWAKMMFESLFGPSNVNNDLSDLKIIKEEKESDEEFAKRLFNFLFCETIQKRLHLLDKANNKKIKKLPICINLKNHSKIALNGIKNYKLTELIERFLDVSKKLSQEGIKRLFDKGDELAIEFIFCASSLRMINYHIPLITKFDNKGIAGNIVHAIATTNAVCAALINITAKTYLLEKDIKKCKLSWINLNSSGNRIINTEPLQPPNPKCNICGNQNIELFCDTNAFTLQELFDKVLKDELGMISPIIDYFFSGGSNFITQDPEIWDDDFKSMNEFFAKPLSKVDICNGAFLRIDDEKQALKMVIVVMHSEKNGKEKFKLDYKKEESTNKENKQLTGEKRKLSVEKDDIGMKKMKEEINIL